MMRSTKLFSVLGLILLASLMVAFVGCGSDDATPTGTVGSLTDPEFMAVQDQLESHVDSTLSSVLAGLSSMSSISAGGNVDPIYYTPINPETDQLTITYADGWHVVNLTKNRDDYAFAMLDSVQFYADDAISQSGVDVDSMWYRHYWSFGAVDTTVTHVTLEGFSGYDFRGLQSGIATIDGANELLIDTKVVTDNSTTWRHFELNSEVSDLVVEQVGGAWLEARPISGVIAMNVSMTTWTDTTDPVVTEWSVTVSFNDSGATVIARSNGVTWTYSYVL